MLLAVLTRVFTERLLHFIFMLSVITGIESQTVALLVYRITPGLSPCNSTTRHIPDVTDYY